MVVSLTMVNILYFYTINNKPIERLMNCLTSIVVTQVNPSDYAIL